MARYRITVEYDGGHFSGWQRQDNAPSVQQALEEAIYRYCQQTVKVHGAGRTDAGVHALGMVASFALAHARPAADIPMALNAHLWPAPVVVLACAEAPDDFHARFSCIGRAYRYEILNRRAPPVLARGRVWWLPLPLDVAAMAEAATRLVGQHDFSAFRSAACQAQSALKTLDAVDVSRDGERVRIEVAARSFLHNQVRIIAGTLREVGHGRISADDITRALTSGDRTYAGPTAPPDGLYFVTAVYRDVGPDY
jgi:tRNA pseudouridine38-40 synthase